MRRMHCLTNRQPPPSAGFRLALPTRTPSVPAGGKIRPVSTPELTPQQRAELIPRLEKLHGIIDDLHERGSLDDPGQIEHVLPGMTHEETLAALDQVIEVLENVDKH
jgi:hypothetical protein